MLRCASLETRIVRGKIRKLVAVLLAVGCLAALLSMVKPSEFVDTFKKISLPIGLASFAVLAASYLLKALRYRVLLGPQAPFRRVFGVTVAQNFIAQIAPARAGDLGYIYLVKRSRLGSLGYGFASLLVCRFVDLLILWAMYVVSLSFLKLESAILRPIAIVIGAGLAVLVAAAFALIAFRGRALTAFEKLLKAMHLLRLGWLRKVWDEVSQGVAQLGQLRSGRAIGGLLLTSLLIWTASTLSNYLIWCAVGVKLTLWQIMFMTSLSYLIGLFPVFLFGGVGTGDAVHAAVLVSFGRSGSAAVSFSICGRVLSIVFQTALGLVAYLLIREELKAPDRSSEETTNE